MIQELPSLDIFSGQTSKRLFFAKINLSDNVWHILDYAISQKHFGSVHSMALHGDWVDPATSADTVDEMNRKARDTDSICSGCLDAFDEAKEIIKDRALMKFENPRILIP